MTDSAQTIDNDICMDCGFVTCICDVGDWENDEGEFDCGQTPGGECELAGSEECEFDCPYRKGLKL